MRLHVTQRTVFPRPCYPSVCQTRALWQNERNLCSFLYHMKDFSSSFSDKKNGWWEATLCTWDFWLNWPRWSENAELQSIFVRSASAVTPSEKSSNHTLIGSHYTLSNEPKMNIVRYCCLYNGRFPSKIALHLKKICYKISLCARQSSNAWVLAGNKWNRQALACLFVQKWFMEDVPCYVKIWPKWPNPFKRFPINIPLYHVSHKTPSQ